ncbi:MAG: CPBP family intramembrane metalloprotease [Clostridia bacterium]|nr:CPBP family intramembrane metalloprotease [Clostridia bacterium]
MLKKIYDKSKIWFAVLWIVAYCVLMSLGDSLSAIIGIEKSVTLFIGILLSATLLLFLRKNGLFEAYGLCASRARARSMIYYVPIVIMLTANFWYGVTINCGVLESLLYILSMLCVGFLEEVIFRGLLFNAMRESNVKTAIIVSSLTFGIGHMINLVNGSGAELLPNLLQVVYATAAGFMFVMIYYKSKSLLVCIAAHGVFNALGVFANESNAMQERRILTALLLAVITGGYAVYLSWTIKGNAKD